nr:hypothetical protein [uncultured Desulfobacter sp.]
MNCLGCKLSFVFFISIIVLFIFFLSSVDASSEQWLPVKDIELRIKPNSILDFTQLFENGEQIIQKKIEISQNGHLTLEGGTNQTGNIKFLCASLTVSSPYGKFPDHSKADIFADQLQKKGYNLVRLHFVDAALMGTQKIDFDYDPKQVDRFHYLLYALKKKGIRWAIDVASSSNGAYGNIKPHRFANVKSLKLRVYWDGEAQNHWKKMVKTILNVNNQYTKTIILKDPALLYVILFNESGIGFISRKGYPTELTNQFSVWLKKKYPDLADNKTPERWKASFLSSKMQEYIFDLETQTINWMSNYIRGLGFEGLISSLNNGRSLQTTASRSQLELITAHAYHDLPSKFTNKGSVQKGNSSIEGALAYIRILASAKYHGKPFGVEEYDQPYWNPYRREAGLALPAIAAFQDWDFICRYTNPIETNYSSNGPQRSKAIYPFGVGVDPIAVAGETLAALLFRRGDIKSARNQTSLALGMKEAVANNGGIKVVPSLLSKLALSTGFGINWIGNSKPLLNQLKLDTNSGVINKLLSKVHEKTVIPQSIYRSDTGEISIEPRNKRMSITTPMTEAVVFDSFTPLTLKYMSVQKSDGPALVALSSVDGNVLVKSSKILLIIATDAINSRSKFFNNRKELINLGVLPVLLKSIDLNICLHNENPEGFSLYALALNGQRKERLNMDIKKNKMEFRINSDQLRNGPSIYFELVKTIKNTISHYPTQEQ